MSTAELQRLGLVVCFSSLCYLCCIAATVVILGAGAAETTAAGVGGARVLGGLVLWGACLGAVLAITSAAGRAVAGAAGGTSATE